MSSDASNRPSEFIPISDQWAAYCFDEAVLSFGRRVENLLTETDSTGKQRFTLEQILDPNKWQLNTVDDLVNALSQGGKILNAVQVTDLRKNKH